MIDTLETTQTTIPVAFTEPAIAEGNYNVDKTDLALAILSGGELELRAGARPRQLLVHYERTRMAADRRLLRKSPHGRRHVDEGSRGREGHIVSQKTQSPRGGALRVLPSWRSPLRRVAGASGVASLCSSLQHLNQAGRGRLPPRTSWPCRIRGAR